MEKELGRNELCWCGSDKKYKYCHYAIDNKIKYYRELGCVVPDRKLIKTSNQIEGIRECGKINTAVLDEVAEKIQPGMSTEELNRLVHDKITGYGAVPATLGYEGFPKSVCTSLNDEVCHGIPSEKIMLKDGDIINVDVTSILHGYYADASRMFCIGSVSEERKSLVETAKQAVEIGLEQARAWNFLGDIGQAVNDYVRSKGYTVVREIGGHGTGNAFHEDPFVSYVSIKGTQMLLVPGMIFTIEPMINAGRAEVILDQANGWTISTKDGRDSAQWEVTVLITENNYEIITY